MGVGTQDLKFNVLARVVGGQAIQGLTDGISNLDRKADLLGKGLKVLAGLYSVDKVKEFALGILDTADSLYKMSQKTGVSVEDLAKLKGVAEISGVSFEELGTSLRKLSVNLVEAGNGNQELGGTFKRLGVNIRESSGGLKDSGTIIKELADKFANLKDGPEKAAIAVKLFGRSGSDIIPLLNRGSEAIDEFSTSMDQDFGARAEKFNETLSLIGKNLKAGGVAGLKEILPTLQEIASAFKQLSSDKSTSTGFFDVVGEAARQATYFTVGLVTALKEVFLAATYGYKEIKSLFSSGGQNALQLDAELAKKLKALHDNEDRILKGLNKNSLITGDGSVDEILARQRADTAPVIKKPSTSADAGAIGENAKIIKSFEEKLAKMRAETDSYGQSNAAKERAILLAELESKGIDKNSASYARLSDEITSTVDARETAKEKQQAKEYLDSQTRQIELERLQLDQIDLTEVEYRKLTEAKKIDNQVTEQTKQMTIEGAQAYYANAEAIKEQRFALIDLEERQKMTYSTGAKGALKEYVQAARDTATQTKNLFRVAFQDMEDALVTFVKGGQLSFRKFADDIITEIIRIQVRMLIAQAATGAVNLFSGFGGGGGTGSGYGSAGGSYSGTGSVAKATPGSSSQGLAKASSYKAAQGGGDVNVSVNVNVEKGTENTQSDSSTGANLGKMVAAVVKAQIIHEKRPGGLLR